MAARGRYRHRLGRVHRPPSRRDAGAGYIRRAAGAGLFAGIHARRLALRLVLRGAFPVRRGDARPRACRQPAVPVHRLGACGLGVIPAHRALVGAALGGGGGEEGVHHHAHRRCGLADRHHPAVPRHRHIRHKRHHRGGASGRHRSRDDYGVRAADIHGRDGQVGAIPLPCVAARRDGRSHARQRADTRRHDGRRGRLSGSAHAAPCSSLRPS